MKVLHVEGGRHLHGGAFQVVSLAKGLAERGHHCLLACRPGSELAAAARPHADVRDIEMRGDGDLRIVVRLLRLIRETRPDLIHLHSRIGADIWGGVAGRFAGLPVVHTRRVDNPEPRMLVASKYRLHDRVIAISEEIGRVLISGGLPARKLRVVRSAVEWERWAHPCDRQLVAERLGIPANALLIGVVAQLIARKGHRYLIAALPAIVAQNPGMRVVFFGRGPMEKELRRLVSDAGLDRVVQIAGFRDDLAEILACLDLLVHPATMEGLGVSLLQTASAGVPIVASRAGGIPEAVRDGENGILVPPGDVPALREAVGSLLADPARCRAFGERGRALMAREFSVGAMVEGNLAVYRELLETSGRPVARKVV
jgi:glycosyltransferase involved in cell wall biosynthesis